MAYIWKKKKKSFGMVLRNDHFGKYFYKWWISGHAYIYGSKILYKKNKQTEFVYYLISQQIQKFNC